MKENLSKNVLGGGGSNYQNTQKLDSQHSTFGAPMKKIIKHILTTQSQESKKTIMKTSKVFKPLIASSLALTLGANIAVADPIITAGNTIDPSTPVNLSDLTWSTASPNYLKPQFTDSGSTTDLENLNFIFSSGQSGITGAGERENNSYTATIGTNDFNHLKISSNQGIQIGSGTTNQDSTTYGEMKITLLKNTHFTLDLSDVTSENAFNGNLTLIANERFITFDPNNLNPTPTTEESTINATFSKSLNGNLNIIRIESKSDRSNAGYYDQYKSNFLFKDGANLNGSLIVEIGQNNFTFENGNITGGIKFGKWDSIAANQSFLNFTFKGENASISGISDTGKNTTIWNIQGTLNLIFERDNANINGKIFTSHEGSDGEKDGYKSTSYIQRAITNITFKGQNNTIGELGNNWGGRNHIILENGVNLTTQEIKSNSGDNVIDGIDSKITAKTIDAKNQGRVNINTKTLQVNEGITATWANTGPNSSGTINITLHGKDKTQDQSTIGKLKNNGSDTLYSLRNDGGLIDIKSYHSSLTLEGGTEAYGGTGGSNRFTLTDSNWTIKESVQRAGSAANGNHFTLDSTSSLTLEGATNLIATLTATGETNALTITNGTGRNEISNLTLGMAQSNDSRNQTNSAKDGTLTLKSSYAFSIGNLSIAHTSGTLNLDSSSTALPSIHTAILDGEKTLTINNEQSQALTINTLKALNQSNTLNLQGAATTNTISTLTLGSTAGNGTTAQNGSLTLNTAHALNITNFNLAHQSGVLHTDSNSNGIITLATTTINTPQTLTLNHQSSQALKLTALTLNGANRDASLDGNLPIETSQLIFQGNSNSGDLEITTLMTNQSVLLDFQSGNSIIKSKLTADATGENVLRIRDGAKLTLEQGFETQSGGRNRFFIDGTLELASNHESQMIAEGEASEIDSEANPEGNTERKLTTSGSGTLNHFDLLDSSKLPFNALEATNGGRNLIVSAGGTLTLETITTTGQDSMTAIYQSSRENAKPYDLLIKGEINISNQGILDISAHHFTSESTLSLDHANSFILTDGKTTLNELSMNNQSSLSLEANDLSISTLKINDTDSALIIKGSPMFEGNADVKNLTMKENELSFGIADSTQVHKLQVADMKTSIEGGGSITTLSTSGIVMLITDKTLNINDLTSSGTEAHLIFAPTFKDESNGILKVEQSSPNPTSKASYSILIKDHTQANNQRLATINKNVADSIDFGDSTAIRATKEGYFYGYILDKKETKDDGSIDEENPNNNGYISYFLKEFMIDHPLMRNTTNAFTDLLGAIAFSISDLYLANFNSLNKRMGELRENDYAQGAWGRIFVGNRSSNVLMDMKSSFTTIQAGYDYAFKIHEATNYLGIALSYSHSDIDTKGKMNYQGFTLGVDSSKSKLVELALYNSYIQDEGWYNDSVMKVSWIIHQASFSALSSDKLNDIYWNGSNKATALTISDEFGYRFRLGENKEWYIDPQAEFGLGYISSNDLVFSNVNFGKNNSAFVTKTRLGASAGYDFKNLLAHQNLKATMYLGLFAELDSFLGGGLNLSALTVKSPLTFDAKGVLNVGTNLEVQDQIRVYVDFEKSFGGKINTDYKINAGVRYSFGEKLDFSDLNHIQPIKDRAAPIKLKEEANHKQEQKSEENNPKEERSKEKAQGEKN